MTEIVPFETLSPAPDLLADEGAEFGRRSQVLATGYHGTVVAYLPVGGEVSLRGDMDREIQWFDPRTGKLHAAEGPKEHGAVRFVAPANPDADRPADWVLVARDAGGTSV